MNYDREILQVLCEAGEKGLSVGKIARHVFNSRNGFFDNVTFDEVRREVASFLTRGCKSSDAVVERTGERGVYRMNLSSVNTGQLMFDFKDDETEVSSEKAVEDQSLSLF